MSVYGCTLDLCARTYGLYTQMGGGVGWARAQLGYVENLFRREPHGKLRRSSMYRLKAPATWGHQLR
jgi:hypothetical protein